MKLANKRTFALALLAGSMLAGVAHAQEAVLATAPPVRMSVDAHGVDVTTGGFTFTLPMVSVGSSGGLEYHRTLIGSGWRDSYVGTINASGALYTVSIGAGSESFTLSGGAFTSNQASGSTLAQSGSSYIYTTSDGVVSTFSPAAAQSFGPWQSNLGVRIDNIRLLDGAVTTFHYEVVDGCGNAASPNSVSANRTDSATSQTSPQSEKTGTGPVTNISGGCDTNARVERLARYDNNLGYRIDLSYNGVNPNGPLSAGVYLPTDILASNNIDSSNLAGWMSVTLPALDGSLSRTITDELGRVKTFSYDSAGHIITYKAPGQTNPQITLSYDGSGRVATFNDGVYTYSYGYSLNGNVLTTTVSGPTGNKVYSADTTLGALTAFTDELGRTTTMSLDSAGRTTQVNRPEGDYVLYTYDTRGNVTKKTSYPKPGSGLAAIAVSAIYPASCTNQVTCNKPTSTTSARGYVTDYTYNTTIGAPLTVTLPAPASGGVRPQMRYVYAAFTAPYGGGSVYRLTSTSSCITSAATGCAGTVGEVKSNIGYNANLLPSTITKASGNGAVSATASTVYDAVGNPFTVDGPLAGSADTTRFRYDAGRQLVGVVGPDPDGGGALRNRAVRLTYEGRGLVTSQESGTVASLSDGDWGGFSPLQQHTMSYDIRGDKITDAVGSGGSMVSLVQTSFNTRGYFQCSAVRDPAYAGSLPGSACATTGSSAPGADRITQATYDAVGNRTQIIEGVASANQATTSAATFGADGEQQTVTDANGNKTTYNFDGYNRVSSINFPDPANVGYSSTAAAQVESYVYDVGSNLTQKTLRAGTSVITYTYDRLERLTKEQHPSTATYANISYAYDNLSRSTSTSAAIYQGATLTNSFSYDALNRLTSETSGLGTVSSMWDSAGRRTRLTWPDGFYVAYDYDVTGAMTAIREYGAGSGIGVLDVFGYDDLGRRTAISRGNGVSTSYGYDGASRLTALTQTLNGQSQSETFGYNLASQVTSRTASNDGWAWNAAYNFDRPYTANGLNEQTTSGSNTITWSPKGTLTADSVSNYAYNSSLQLTGSAGSTQSYDGAGRLFGVGVSGATRFLYDGQAPIAEYDSNGTVLRRYVRGPATDEPLVWYEGSGTSARYALTADRLGSVTAVSSDTGAAAAVNTYDEYGIPGAGNAGRFQYTGQAFLSEIGVYNYKARNYSPTLGRFMQTDPVGYGDSKNLYAYVGGDPINRSDPSGTVQESLMGPTVPHETSSGLFFTPFEAGSYGGATTDGESGHFSTIKVVIKYVSYPAALDAGPSTSPEAALEAASYLMINPSLGRDLNPRELHFYSNFYDLPSAGSVSVHDGISFAGSDILGITLGKDIFISHQLYNGDMLASAVQAGLLGHEIDHAINQTLPQILSSYAECHCYYNSSTEIDARRMEQLIIGAYNRGVR